MKLDRRATGALATFAAFLALGLTACSESTNPSEVLDRSVSTAIALDHGGQLPTISDITICKEGGGGRFEIDLTHPDLATFEVFLFAGDCQVVYTSIVDDGLRKLQTLIATELEATNSTLEKIIVVWMDQDGRITETEYTDITSIPLGAVVGGTGMTATFINTPTNGGDGCTPGAWKNRLFKIGEWGPTGYSPGQSVASAFSEAGNAPYAHLGAATLHDGLSFKGGNTVAEKAEILLRAGIAALLNASHPGISYPRTAADVIADVNAALASQDPTQILTLATELDTDNNLGCSL